MGTQGKTEPPVVEYCRDVQVKNKHVKGTSKNHHRHAELVSASPYLQGIAGQARNDESQKTEFLEVPLCNKNICFSYNQEKQIKEECLFSKYIMAYQNSVL